MVILQRTPMAEHAIERDLAQVIRLDGVDVRHFNLIYLDAAEPSLGDKSGELVRTMSKEIADCRIARVELLPRRLPPIHDKPILLSWYKFGFGLAPETSRGASEEGRSPWLVEILAPHRSLN